MERIDRARIRDYMEKHNLDLFVTMDPQLGHFITGWMPFVYRDWTVREAPLIFVFPRDAEPFIVFRRPTRAQAPPGLNIRDEHIYPAGSLLAEKTDVLVAQLQERNFRGRRIGLEMELVPALVTNRLTAAFPKSEYHDASALSRTLITVKQPDQIACIKHALTATEEGIRAMLGGLKRQLAVGGSAPRIDIMNLYRQTLLEHGVQPYDEEPFSRAEGLYKKGETLAFDLFSRYKGFVSDFAVQFYLGDTVPPELVERTERAWKIIDIIVQTIQPGMAGIEAEAACDAALTHVFGDRYESEGIVDWWMTHGLGMGIHEEPLLGADVGGGRKIRECTRAFKETVRFEPGLVFNVELLGFGEETFVVQDKGITRLGSLRTGVYAL